MLIIQNETGFTIGLSQYTFWAFLLYRKPNFFSLLVPKILC